MFQYGWFLPQHNTSDKKSVACPENVFWEEEAPRRKSPTQQLRIKLCGCMSRWPCRCVWCVLFVFAFERPSRDIWVGHPTRPLSWFVFVSSGSLLIPWWPARSSTLCAGLGSPPFLLEIGLERNPSNRSFVYFCSVCLSVRVALCWRKTFSQRANQYFRCFQEKEVVLQTATFARYEDPSC